MSFVCVFVCVCVRVHARARSAAYLFLTPAVSSISNASFCDGSSCGVIIDVCSESDVRFYVKSNKIKHSYMFRMEHLTCFMYIYQ